MYDRRIFQANLKSIIEMRGETQRSLSEKLGIAETTVSRYVAGIRSPDIEMLAKMCEVLHVGINDLIGIDSPSKPRPPIDEIILVDCYRNADDRDRKILWSVLDRYMSPEQRALIQSARAQEKDRAV